MGAGPESMPRVTIVVVPREVFSVAKQSLAAIFETADIPFDLVYIDGNSPRRLARWLRREADRRGFRLIRRDRFLSPNEARNIGWAEARTPYVAFIDNDVIPESGWLSKLLDCADRSGAAAVGPLYLEGAPEAKRVHMAGGHAEVRNENGRRSLAEGHFHAHELLANLPSESLVTRPVQVLEFHCMLVRREILRDLDGLDENLLSCNEHLDFCLTLGQAGAEAWMVPSARVTYLNRTPSTLYDLRYFLLRWSHAWNTASLAHFAQKYGLSTDGDDFSNVAYYLKMRRRQAFGRPLRWLAPHVSQHAFDRILAKADKVSARLLGYRQAARPNRGRVDRAAIAR